ncbi:MAG: YncE family protein [Acidobacteriota bacterium]
MKVLAGLLLLLLPVADPAPSDVLLVLDGSSTILLFDPKSGAALGSARVGKGPHEVEMLADGDTAAVSNYGESGEAGRTLTLIDLNRRAAGATIDLGKGTRPHGLQALPNGHVLVVAQGTKEVLVVDPRLKWVVARIPTGLIDSRLVAATPDGARAFVTSERSGSGLITVIDLKPPRIVRDIVIGAAAEGMDVTPDGREVWITNSDLDSVWVLEARDLGIVSRISTPRFPTDVKVTPDGKYALVACTESGDVAVVDVATRREVKRISIAREALMRTRAQTARGGVQELPEPFSLLVEPDGSHAWVASANTSVVCHLDLRTLTVSGSLTAGRDPGALAGRFAARR